MLKVEDLTKRNILPWLIIGFGAAFRLSSYFFNRCLRLDEAMLSLNILEKSYAGLLNGLDYAQGAPFGFLVLEKAVTDLFNGSEYALRLIPLLAGIVSLILFYFLARKMIEGKAVYYALGLFALSGHLIFFSSDVKQYSTDVLIAIILLILFAWSIRTARPAGAQGLVLGLAGALSVWFSHPAVFILAGSGLCLIGFSLFRREWSKLCGFIFAAVLWVLSFAAVYILSLGDLSRHAILLEYWERSRAFMPFPPSSFSDVKWFLQIFTVFDNPGGLYFAGLAALAFVVGAVSLYSRKRESALILLVPILVTLAASGPRKYPFQGRLLLFIAPVLILFVAQGLEQIREATRSKVPLIGAAVIFLIFLHPLASTSYHAFRPYEMEEIKPVIQYVKENKKEGDTLYVYHLAIPAFKYYSRFVDLKTDLPPLEGVSSEQDWGRYLEDLNRLRGRGRVWLIFAPIGLDEQKFFYAQLGAAGTKLDSFVGRGAAAYLYSF